MKVKVCQVGVLSINFRNIWLADGAISLMENNAIYWPAASFQAYASKVLPTLSFIISILVQCYPRGSKKFEMGKSFHFLQTPLKKLHFSCFVIKKRCQMVFIFCLGNQCKNGHQTRLQNSYKNIYRIDLNAQRFCMGFNLKNTIIRPFRCIHFIF